MQKGRNSMGKVTFGRLLNHDFKSSMMQNPWRWVGAMAVFLFLTYAIAGNFRLLDQKPGVGGIFIYLLKGSAPYTRTENSQFQLPVLWLLYHIYFYWLIGDYPAKDLRGYGKLVFLQIADRKKWWLSKCIWVVLSAIIYEALFWGVSFLYLTVTSRDQYTQMEGVCRVLGLKGGIIGLWGIFICLVTMIWLGWLQFYLSLIMRPVLAVLATLILLICACYFYTPLFPGNFMMLSRTCEMDGELTFLLRGSIVLVIISAILIWRGASFMKQYQLMG